MSEWTFPHAGQVMALADAADQQDWVEVQRLLRAGPRLSLPQGPNCPHWSESLEFTFWSLSWAPWNTEWKGTSQRGGDTLTTISTHCGSSDMPNSVPPPACHPSLGPFCWGLWTHGDRC